MKETQIPIDLKAKDLEHYQQVQLKPSIGRNGYSQRYSRNKWTVEPY